MLQVAFDKTYAHPLPENHRFPMEKYDLLPKQLLLEGTLEENHFFIPGFLNPQFALDVHDENYLNRLNALELTPREQRVSGFPHSIPLIEREYKIMEGTRMCAQLAKKSNGVAFNIAGGTHHAFSNKAEGFCLLNDQAIAARWLLNQNLANQILIIDLDVHQGNGTAEIFKNESKVFTFSMHGDHNYPLHKEKSDLDVPLLDAMNDEVYLNLLAKNLEIILGKITPDFIFYQCGVDILGTDKLGRLNITLDGCKKRDEIVFQLVKQLNIPAVCSMGGGYSPDIKTIIEAHANTFRVAVKLFE
jgi:acetoin utilization deacetylase AcuC-like enzyme